MFEVFLHLLILFSIYLSLGFVFACYMAGTSNKEIRLSDDKISKEVNGLIFLWWVFFIMLSFIKMWETIDGCKIIFKVYTGKIGNFFIKLSGKD